MTEEMHGYSGAGEPFSIAILAGGTGDRMGGDKAMRLLGGRPVVSYLMAGLGGLADDLFIAGGDAETFTRFGLPVCADHFSVRASLVGIYSALASARRRRCLVVACDMPFADPELIGLLARLAPGYDAVIPESAGGREPLLALYSRSCMGEMRRGIEAGDLRIMDSLSRLHVRYVSRSEVESVCDPRRVFFNVNTPAALVTAERWLGDDSGAGAVPVATELVGTPLICFVGNKDSGKTTLIEKLVPVLAARGLRTAFIKHDVHGFDMDHRGTDTYRIWQAGAGSVVISSPEAVASMVRVKEEKRLAHLHAGIDTDVDLVLAEGFKQSVADKIEVSRSGRSRTLACPEEELIAVVSDRPDAAATIPVIDLDDVDAVAELLITRYGLGCGSGA